MHHDIVSVVVAHILLEDHAREVGVGWQHLVVNREDLHPAKPVLNLVDSGVDNTSIFRHQKFGGSGFGGLVHLEIVGLVSVGSLLNFLERKYFNLVVAYNSDSLYAAVDIVLVDVDVWTDGLVVHDGAEAGSGQGRRALRHCIL